MKYLFTLSCLCGIALLPLRAVEFTLVAYNVENLFDVDGRALFDDYRQDDPENPFAYTREKLWTKLRNTATVLKTVNDGAGPEIILFQELEGDFTPESTAGPIDAFLEEYSGTTVEAMLGEDWRPEYAGFSAAAWLAKTLADAGLGPYEVVVGAAKPAELDIAHVNAVFSTFPIRSAEFHPIEQARDIAEVEIEIEGRSLWVYNNHWKSGASNPAREPIRVQNAEVQRTLVDARLAEDPAVDLIVGGDLNSHYNHSRIFPDIKTGMNTVLKSDSDETFADSDLYNLWFELPPEERYSEVWRGRKGTLMHLILSPGLYDDAGINYVDGSFAVLQLPGINTDALGRPLDWSFAGRAGGGFSDHFPILARFTTDPFRPDGELNTGEEAPDFEFPLLPSEELLEDLPDGAFLGEVPDSELGPYIGKLYEIEARVIQANPVFLQVGDSRWSAYSFDPEILEELRESADEDSEETLELVVSLGIWKGKRQFIVEVLD